MAGTLVLPCLVSTRWTFGQFTASGDSSRQFGVDGRLIEPLLEDWCRGGR